ncbi:MAG: DNA polymerase III subunit delta [Dehalococcoidia bacterium]|nr:DNA polymerase III subunit delta [Dehalococcoidia bacterium]
MAPWYNTTVLYILYGKDDFSLHEALEHIKTGLGDREMLAANTVSLDGQRLTSDELSNSCNTTPFLLAHRLVVVHGLMARFEVQRGKSASGRKRHIAKSGDRQGEWQDFASCIQQMAPTTVLVLIDGDLKGPCPLRDRLSTLAEVKSFPLLTGKSLGYWIAQRVSGHGGTITSRAVSLLADLIGGDLWTMGNEILKLTLYASGRAIEENDVRELVSYAQEANIFALVDAVLEGRGAVAQVALHRLYQEGALPTYILAMITRQVRLMALAKESGSELSAQRLQDKLGLTSGYALNKALKQARMYSFEHIRQLYEELLQTDVAIKTGKRDGGSALELLIAELSTRRG